MYSQANAQTTGYPSVDKPWLKYYQPGAEEKAVDFPAGKSVEKQHTEAQKREGQHHRRIVLDTDTAAPSHAPFSQFARASS